MNGVTIERLARELCDKSGCHHKCKNTKDCVVEDEAKLMVSDKEKQIEEIANDINMHCCSLAEQFCGETSCNACLTNFLYNAGYRRQSEGEWEMFDLITSTYYGKRYYFLNEDGSVYSRASHSNMSRDEAIDEFLSIFRE